MPSPAARIVVIVASKGRSDMLRGMIPHINAQTLLPASFILTVTEKSDAAFDLAEVLDPRISGELIYATPGSCSQRNAALDRIGSDTDIVVFYDDDFYPSRHALQAITTAFSLYPDVDGITGKLIADGIVGSGLTSEAADGMLQEWDSRLAPTAPQTLRIIRDTVGLYGCNMAYRASAIRGLRFDEALPAYGWQEDVDFAAQIAGRRVEIQGITGVHLGTRAGREIRGRQLGYSQVVNPYYLWRKGTLSGKFSLQLAARNLLANHLKVLRPEPWIDRRGRLAGNWVGLSDILRGRADPRRNHPAPPARS